MLMCTGLRSIAFCSHSEKEEDNCSESDSDIYYLRVDDITMAGLRTKLKIT
jgi:hypothetical protein